MPIVTLCADYISFAWQVRICGRSVSSMNLSKYQFKQKGAGPEPNSWLITHYEEPKLKSHEFPLTHVTEYLEELEDQGYKIITSNGGGAEKGGTTSYRHLVWTLQK